MIGQLALHLAGQAAPRIASAAAVGLVLSAVTWLWAWAWRSRSAKDRAALWAIGLGGILTASAVGLVVRPVRLPITLPAELAPRHEPLGLASRGPAPQGVSRPSVFFAPGIALRASVARPTLSGLELLAVAIWLLVAAALVVRWGLGFLRAFHLLRRSFPPDPVLSARLRSVSRGLGEGATRGIRLHEAIPVPLTVSLWRGTILLPTAARTWKDERLLAVISHELAHVRRWDGLARSMVRLCAALHWFNPLIWFGARWLEEIQEVAADDAILEAGWLPSCYARELLAIADALNADARLGTAVVPMVEPGGLMARLSLILEPARSYAFSPRLVAGAAMAFATLAAALVSLRATVSFAAPNATAAATAPGRSEDGGYAYARPSAESTDGRAASADDGSVPLAAGQGRPGGIAADRTSLYWTNFEGGSVMKLPLRGGDPMALASGENGPQSLALDAERVYWTNFRDGTVKSVPLVGGASAPIAFGQDHPSGLALDAAFLYWVNSDGSVVRVSLSGGAPVELVPGAGSGEPSARSLAIDSTYLYWTEGGDIAKSDGRVLRLDLADRHVIVLADRQDSPCRLAVDGRSVYWTNLGTRANRLGDGTVMKVAREGGPAVILAASQLQPLGIAVDGQNLYWTRAPLDDVADGTVMRMPLSGGLPAVAAWQQHRPAGLALTASGVYWTDIDDGTIRSLKD